jgi:hypothetical protein
MLTMLAALAVHAFAASAAETEVTAPSDDFTVTAADGYVLRGEVDRPAGRSAGAVVLVAGTGAFDRDMRFGRSGTPRDLVFADLGERFAKRGLTAVRYDRRGVRHGTPPAEVLDLEAYKNISAESLSADVGAVDAWVRAPEGLNAQCVVYFVHSEGAAHLAGRAEAGMTAPNLIIGMGAPMESKVSAIRWQMTGRDGESLRMMDTDQDGRITNAEVRANWMKTPSAVFGRLDPYLHPEGAWTAEDLEKLQTNQAALYTAEVARVEALPADGPYPNAQAPVFSTGWWKSWFMDDKPMAARFAEWPTPMILHYGEIDSQVREARQRAAAEGVLAPGQATFVSHPERGHSLGEESLMGPIDEHLADRIADEAAKGCA